MPPKVGCIVGPTGCGKTGLGVALAERLGGEVVSCDSMQLYRGMVIGTAAPTAAAPQAASSRTKPMTSSTKPMCIIIR